MPRLPALSRPAAFLLLGSSLALTGCRGMINGVIKKGVMDDAMAWEDLELSCTFGQSAVGLVQPVGRQPADVAMIVGWVPAGVCAELDAWEARRQEALIMENHGGAPDEKVAAATDAAYSARRSFALAAKRYDKGWQHWESRYGGVEDCSKLPDREQQVYLLGLLSGALSVVNDASAKQALGVPQNRLLEVARRSECLDDTRFFHIPQSVRAAAWATIPGSGPEDADPWAMLAEAAAAGDAAGNSIPRALMVFTAANAGNDAVLEEALRGFDGQPVGVDAQGQITEWRLMDAYGRRLSLYQSDLLWIRTEGHRTPRLGELPAPPAGSDDPFGGSDPFGGGADPFADPFAGAAPAPGEDAPAPDGSTGEPPGADTPSSPDPADSETAAGTAPAATAPGDPE